MKNSRSMLLPVCVVLALSFVLNCASAANNLKETADMPGYQPKEGMVPDAKTAIAIAVAVWNPIYGDREIASQRPHNAVLKDGKWTVTGSLKTGWVGGVATAIISKSDARVLKIFHGK